MPEMSVVFPYRHLTAVAEANQYSVKVTITDEKTGEKRHEKTIDNTFSDALTRLHGQENSLGIWREEMANELLSFLDEVLLIYVGFITKELYYIPEVQRKAKRTILRPFKKHKWYAY